MAEPESPEDPTGEQELLDLLNTIEYRGIAPEERRSYIIARLMRADWGKEAGVIEANEYLLFPDVLVKRMKDGSWHEQPVFLRVPRDGDMRKGRVEARALAAKEGIDEKQDRDLFTSLENLCILTYAIRNNTAPYEPYLPEPLSLERKYDKICLQNMWEKLNQLQQVLNPAPDQLSNGEIVALIAAIARSRNLGPLVVYGPVAQTSFVVSMVDMLLNSLGSKLSSGCIERLMRAS